MTKQAENEVILAKQSYREARESGLVGELQLIGCVIGSSCKGALSHDALIDATFELISNAKRLNATHVFGLEYQATTINRENYPTTGHVLVSGDAYREITTKNNR